MGLESIKRSLVVLDRSLDTLEEVILKREEIHQSVLLSKQIDMFGEEVNGSIPIDRDAVVEKLDHVIASVTEVLKV
jgi:hypothetical protein